MGEAKRKAKYRFTEAQYQQLERLVESVYRRVREGLAAARAADAADPAAVIAALHGETAVLVDSLTEDFFATDAEGPATKARIACAKGCSFCCHANVEVTIIEAVAVARRVEGDASLRESVLATAPKVAGMPGWARFDLRIPCALLRDGVCSIYDVRPRACRAHVSYSAALCEEVLTCGDSRSLAPVVAFGWPRSVSKAIGQGTNHAIAHEGLQPVTVELNAAVAKILVEPDLVDRWLKGQAVFVAFPGDP